MIWLPKDENHVSVSLRFAAMRSQVFVGFLKAGFSALLLSLKEAPEDVILKQTQVTPAIVGRVATPSVFGRFTRHALLAAGCAFVLAGCNVEAQKSSLDSAAVQPQQKKAKENQSAKAPEPVQVASKVDASDAGRALGYDKTGKPYTVSGKLYVPKEQTGYTATGLASWYGVGFHGRETANGEVFNRESVTVAHPTLPLPSYVRVTNVLNGRSIIARVNDRGPFKGNRLVDVSEQVAIGLNFKHLGTTRLKVDYIGRAPVNVDDSAMLQATLRVDGTSAQLGGRGVATQVAKIAPSERAAAFTQDPFGEESRSGFDRADAGAAPAQAQLEVVPLPPQRPVSMGEASFKPQFEGVKMLEKPALVEKSSDVTSSAVAVSGEESAKELLPSRIPLPPVRPAGLGNDTPSERTAAFDAPVSAQPVGGFRQMVVSR